MNMRRRPPARRHQASKAPVKEETAAKKIADKKAPIKQASAKRRRVPIEHGSDSPAKRELIPNPKQGRGKGEKRPLEDSAHAVDAAAVSARY